MHFTVIGRGIAGLSTAFALLQKGFKVTVIGPNSPLTTATHAAVGLSSLKGQFHAKKPLFAAKVAGHLFLPNWLASIELVSKLPIPRFFADSIEPYWTLKDFERIRERVFHRDFSGHTGARLDSAITSAYLSENPLGAAVYDSDFWYDPRIALQSLERAISSLGGTLDDRLVHSIHQKNGIEAVLTVDKPIKSDHCILAAGIYSNKILENSGIKAPKMRAVAGETLLFDKLSADYPQIIHIGKSHFVRTNDAALFGSSSFDIAELPALNDLKEGRVNLGADDFKPSRSLKIDTSIKSICYKGVRARFADMGPGVGELNVPESKNKLILFSGFYKSGLQLAPLFAQNLSNFFDASSAFLCPPKFFLSRFPAFF